MKLTREILTTLEHSAEDAHSELMEAKEFIDDALGKAEEAEMRLEDLHGEITDLKDELNAAEAAKAAEASIETLGEIECKSS